MQLVKQISIDTPLSAIIADSGEDAPRILEGYLMMTGSNFTKLAAQLNVHLVTLSRILNGRFDNPGIAPRTPPKDRGLPCLARGCALARERKWGGPMNYPAQAKTSEGRPGARFGRVASPGAGFDHAVKEKYPRSVRPHSRSQGSLSEQESFWAAVSR